MPKNKVVINGVTQIDLTPTTAVASDVASGKYFYAADGTLTEGTASGGGIRTTIIPEQTITSSSQYTYLQTFIAPIVVGENYIITVNGTEYTGTAYLDGNPCLRVPGTTSGEIVYVNGNMLYYAGSSSDYGTYIIKVEQEISGGGIIREPIVPQTTVTGVVGDWVRLTSGSTPSIVDGEFYSYTINGTEYLATGTTNNGIVYLSDILWDWSISGNAIGYDIQYGGIWLNVSTAGSYTVKVDKITLANSGLKTQVIFPEQTVTATTTEQSGYSANISVSENITDGANYIVTMDGTAYLCYGKQLYGNNDVYCGDDTVIWGTPANARYPFMVATWGNGVTAWGVANNQAHTVKIEKVLSFDSAELGTKTITANGTYSASSDDLDGYSSVTVNVSGGSVNIGTVTTTNSSNQNTSIDFTLPSGRTPKAFFCRLTSQIARNSSSRYYYVYDMRWDGSSTGGVAGNTFYMYSGTLTNVTSGYSYSQSGTTFTLSSTGTRSTSPGSFYNGTYELVYIY